MVSSLGNLPIYRLWGGTEGTVALEIGAVLLPVANSQVVLVLQEVGSLPSLNAIAGGGLDTLYDVVDCDCSASI